MKTLLVCASAACFTLASCSEFRDTMMVVPDRQGHAATNGIAAAPTEGKGTNVVVAIPGKEMYITLGAQDTLSSVAKAYNVTLEWLIKRNRLTKPAKPGDNLIVPLSK